MTGSEYQKLAMRTNDGMAINRLHEATAEFHTECKDFGGIINACLGLSGEVGEFNDMIKKWVFHEKELDIEHAKKEADDIAWYLAMLCESFGWDLDEILKMNVEKLKARYPEGFDTYLANHRAEGDV